MRAAAHSSGTPTCKSAAKRGLTHTPKAAPQRAANLPHRTAEYVETLGRGLHALRARIWAAPLVRDVQQVCRSFSAATIARSSFRILICRHYCRYAAERVHSPGAAIRIDSYPSAP